MKHSLKAYDAMALAVLLLTSIRSADSFLSENRRATRAFHKADSDSVRYLKRKYSYRASQSRHVLQQGSDDETVTVMQKPVINDGSVETDTTALSNTPDKNQNLGDPVPGTGLVVLCSVPLVWGTYVPIVRLLYEVDPPIPGFLFSVCYFFISAVTTIALSGILKQRNDEGTDSIPIENASEQKKEGLLAGIELGSWLFTGNTLQLLGLKTVPADRAGFLVQMTTILVPLMSALLVGNILAVDGTTWVACLIALAGIIVMNIDLSEIVTATSGTVISSGDVLILSSALMYTMHVIRLSRWAPAVPPLELAAYKSTVETALSVILVSVSVAVALSSLGSASEIFIVSFLRESGKELITFFNTVSERMVAGTLSTDSVIKAAGATFWAGWVGTAYVIFAQSFGQQRVGASEANLIYSLQPIFTATFAYFLLGETMDASGFLGGGLILIAVLLVASKQNAVERN